MREKISIFETYGRGDVRLTEVLLPKEFREDFKVKQLLGICDYSYKIPHTWFDRVSRYSSLCFPCIEAAVVFSSIKHTSVLDADYRIVSFTTVHNYG